ncbi:uncharacterized protein [Danio rerio]|uniref:Uncharacterized protein n=1 Tax=Danio rerio TaxID=7955 RepID=A0A8M2BGK3_DANRE
MISLKTLCLLYFALLVRLTHAEESTTLANNDTKAQHSTTIKEKAAKPQDANNTATNDTITQGRNNPELNITTNDTERKNNQTTSNLQTEYISPSSSSASSPKSTGPPPVCTPATTKSPEYQCIFSLPSGEKLHLIVAVLIVGCLVLLMTTLMCACQVCHLKGLISGLHSRHDNIDLHAIREKTETRQKNEDRVDRHPTETCLLLSEVTAGQEQSKEHEVKIEEVEEMEQIGTEMPVIDPNGDVNQENSIVPEEKQSESSDKPEV